MKHKKKIIYTIATATIGFWGFTMFSGAPTPFGWDYNLTKKCAKTTLPGQQNYYEETAQCGTDGKKWTLAVQSEQVQGSSCTGPNTQSFLINGPGSPVTLSWLPHTDEFGRNNWTAHLNTNFGDITHPCGENNFTWYVFMDHISHGGGPLPRPDKTKFSATVNFNDFTPNGATRAIALFQGFWNGKSHLVELTFQGANWGDNYPNDPLVFDVKTNDQFNFVGVDGKALGIEIPRLTDTKLEVLWHNIIQTLIDKGYLPAPTGGWANSATTAVGIGHEVHNWSSDNSAIADLWFTNFRIESQN